MKEKWLALNQREQHLVIVMACFIGIFIFYMLIWQPLNNAISDKEKKITRAENLVTWLQEQQAQFHSLASSQRKTSNASLSTIVNRSASTKGITIARVQPQGEELNVSIDQVPFNVLMDWLENMSAQQGVSVKAIDLAKTDTKGVVRVRRLNLGKG